LFDPSLLATIVDVKKEVIDVRAGRLLGQTRQQAVLTQAEVAAKAGLPQSTVSAYESGRRQPTLAMLSKLLEAMGSELTLAAEPLPERLTTLTGPVGLRIRRHRHQIAEAATRHGVENVRVLGPATRGEDKPGDLIEFLVDQIPEATVMKVHDLTSEFQQIIGAPVKIVTTEGLPPKHQATAEHEGILL